MADHHLSWVSHLFRALWAEGVRHIYISPGSRSTPLVQAAAAHPGFQKHVILDERSAAFQALGTGKASGMPALVICTSGTAVANCHPAVIEAGKAGVPLIIISADRPPHLRGTGSSQTIDQVKLFGDSVVLFHELGEPVHSEEDYNRLTLLAHQSVSMGRDPGGAVHLNAPFRKPLEASRKALEEERERNLEQIRANRERQLAHDSTLRHSRRHRLLPEEVIERINRASRPLLIAGPDEPSRVAGTLLHQLSVGGDIPVIAEPGSHLPRSPHLIHHYDLLLRWDWLKSELKPDLIIRTGDNPTGACFTGYAADNRDVPVLQLLSRRTWQESTFPATERVRLPHPLNSGGEADRGWGDETETGADRGRGSQPLSGDETLKSNLAEQNDELPAEMAQDRFRDREAWLNRWKQADADASRQLDEHLARETVLTDGHVIRHFTNSHFNTWQVMTSNSFTIRDLALFGQPDFHAARSFANRGAAGIDGILSTAVGTVRATGRKTLLFVGDLALLHDAGALASLRDLKAPQVVIVLNNGGGTIFRMLPVYSPGSDHTTYFETPQNVDLEHLARAHHLPFQRVRTPDELPDPEVLESLDESMVIECVTDADHTMELRNRLWRAALALGVDDDA